MKALGHVFKYGDNVDTDVIIPARYLNSFDPQELASHAMVDIDPDFVKKVQPGDLIVANKNFGCGSSREHAALVPLYLGVSAVITKSFARIHRANLINAGILPLEFQREEDYEKISQGDEIEIFNLRNGIDSGSFTARVKPVDDSENDYEIMLKCELSKRQKDIIRAGGLLKYVGGRQ